jgi:hypothetical protein
MSIPRGVQTTGSLFAIRSPMGETLRRLPLHAGLTARSARVSGWHHLTFRTDTRLLEFEPEHRREYVYEFLVREAGPRYLLVSDHSELVDRLLARVGQKPYVRPPSVKVHSVAATLLESSGEYALSGLWAKVNGFGRAIRSLVLYGDDMRHASVVREIFHLLVTTRVQLRNLTTRQEVLSISARGEVSFFYRGESTLSQVDTCLRYLRDGHFLDWDIDG